VFDIESPFSMVVLIVAIVFGANIWRTHMLTRARRTRSSEDLAVIASLTDQVERLAQRVQVLEKLATDDDRKLAREIEGLRRNDEKDMRG
jgi:phage shock protein B